MRTLISIFVLLTISMGASANVKCKSDVRYIKYREGNVVTSIDKALTFVDRSFELIEAGKISEAKPVVDDSILRLKVAINFAESVSEKATSIKMECLQFYGYLEQVENRQAGHIEELESLLKKFETIKENL